MSYRLLSADDAFWRPSNQMGVDNTDFAKQLGADNFGARLWRLRPGQASTRHRHRTTVELYVLLEGIGRVRVDQEVLTLGPLSFWSSQVQSGSCSTTPRPSSCGLCSARRRRRRTHSK